MKPCGTGQTFITMKNKEIYKIQCELTECEDYLGSC